MGTKAAHADIDAPHLLFAYECAPTAQEVVKLSSVAGLLFSSAQDRSAPQMDFDRSRYRTYRIPFHSFREASRIEQYLAINNGVSACVTEHACARCQALQTSCIWALGCRRGALCDDGHQLTVLHVCVESARQIIWKHWPPSVDYRVLIADRISRMMP